MSKKRRLNGEDAPHKKKRRLTSTNPATNIRNTVDEKKMNDVEFIIGKEKEHVSGIGAYFAAQSEPIKAMLYGTMYESLNGEVILADITPQAFRYFRDIAYLKNPQLKLNNIIDVMYLGITYLIPAIKKKCMETIKAIRNAEELFTVFQCLNKYPTIVFEKFTMKLFNGSFTYDDEKDEHGDVYELVLDITHIISHRKFNETVSPAMMKLVLKSWLFKHGNTSERVTFKYKVLRDYAKYTVGDKADWKAFFRTRFSKYIQFQALSNTFLMTEAYQDGILSPDIILSLINSAKYGFSLSNFLLSKAQILSLNDGNTVYYRLDNGEFVEVIVETDGYTNSLTLRNANRNIEISDGVEIFVGRCLPIEIVKDRNGITKQCIKNKKVGDTVVVYIDHQYNVDRLWTHLRPFSLNKIKQINVDGQIRVVDTWKGNVWAHGDSKEEIWCGDFNCDVCVIKSNDALFS